MEQQRHPTYRTTSEAASDICQAFGIDHVPGYPERIINDKFLQALCRDDQFPNAKKESNRWQIPLGDIEIWIEQNRPMPSSKSRRIKACLTKIFHIRRNPIIDSFAWWLDFVPSLVKLVGPILALIIFVVMKLPSFVNQVTVPPGVESETLVLVADILIESCIEDSVCANDPNSITQQFVNHMREALADHPSIRVERLQQYIYEEGGHELAMEMGQERKYNAAFIIRGNYVLEPEPEVYISLDIMEQNLPFFGNDYDRAYSPSQIQQPSMFEFKIVMGQQWANFIIFATGLALYQNSDYVVAEPLLNSAAEFFGTAENFTVDSELMRSIYFYHGSNYLYLGQAKIAEPILTTLLETFDSETLSQSELGPLTLVMLGMNYLLLGQYDESLEYSEQALEISLEIKNRHIEGFALGNQGSVYFNLDQYRKAIEFYEKSLDISRENSDRANEGTWLGNLGMVHLELFEYDKAIEYTQQSLAIFREIKNYGAEARVLNGLGIIYSKLGQYDKSIGLFDQALAIARQTNNRMDEGTYSGHLGITYLGSGDYNKAVEALEKATVIAQEFDDLENTGVWLIALGDVYSNLKKYDKAIEYYEEAITISHEVNDKKDESMAIVHLGDTYFDIGEHDKAIDFYERALVISQETNNRKHEGFTYDILGSAYYNLDQYDLSIEYYKKALVISEERNDLRGIGLAHGGLGNVYRNLGQYDNSTQRYEEALAVLQKIHDLDLEATYLITLATNYFDLSQHDKAAENYERAFAISREINDRELEGKALMVLGISYRYLCKYEKAIQANERALKIARDLNDYQLEGMLLGDLGVIYNLRGKYKRAINYQTEAINLLERNNLIQDAYVVHLALHDTYENAYRQLILGQQPNTMAYCE